MTSDSVAHREKAPDPSKNDVLREDIYEEPKWSSIRDEPGPVIVAETRHAVAGGNLDADDQDSDDDSSSSDDTICPDTPSRSSTPRPRGPQASTPSQFFLNIPTLDCSTGKYISLIKIEEEPRHSSETISPFNAVDELFFFAISSKYYRPERPLLPIYHSPVVWQCRINRGGRYPYIEIWPFWDSGFDKRWHLKSIKDRLKAEYVGYRLVLMKGLRRGWYVDPHSASAGLVAASSDPPPVLRLPQGESPQAHADRAREGTSVPNVSSPAHCLGVKGPVYVL